MSPAMRVLSIAVVCVLVACHKPSGTGPAGPLSSTWSGPPLLAYVPADTPYLMAVLQPPSAALRQRMLDEFSSSARDAVKKLDAVRPADASNLAPWMRAVFALRDELHGDDPAQWATDLGFDPNGRMVIYGLGLWPVLRYDLLDPAKLRAAIQRVAAAGGPMVQARTFHDHAYWTVAIEELTLIGAIVDHHAMVALVPTANLDAALPHLLGTKLPGDSLRTASVLPALVARHGFGPALVGYVDSQRLVDVIEQGGPLHDATTAQLGAALTPACRADVARIVAVAPRIAFGYKRLDEQGMDARIVLETPAWLTQQLSHLRAEVPAPPITGVPMLAAGIAFDGDAMHAWLGQVAEALRAHPLTCPALAELDDAAGDLGKTLAQPMPPMLQGLRGVSLVIDDATAMPPSGTGHVVLFGDHVDQLVALASSKLPLIASLHLTADGAPVALPVALLGMSGLKSAHVGMKAGRLALAVGDHSEQAVTDELAAPAHGPAPLVTFAYDPKRLVEGLGPLLHDSSDMGQDSFASIAMVLDAADDGLALDVSGTWAPLPAPAAH